MLPNFARKVFYTLHDSPGAGRGMADALCHGFMAGVKGFGVKPPYDRTPLTLISHKYKFIYIGIPKTATRSFRSYFYDEHKADYKAEMHETRGGFEKALRKYKDYYKFSFVRHPVYRTLSCYQSKIAHGDLSLLKRARILSFYPGLEPGMSFHDFVRWLNSAEGSDTQADRHWMSQYKFLYDENGAKLCDFVGRYEHLESDLELVRRTLGLPDFMLPRVGWISHSEDQVNPDTRNLIEQRYAKDYHLFGFDA